MAGSTGSIHGGAAMAESAESEPNAITLYALQTCSHCKAVKKLLSDRGLDFKTIYVDMLLGDERSDTLRALKRINPSVSFPTLSVGRTVIVGFKKEEIKAALDTH